MRRARSKGRPEGGWIPDTERKPALKRIRERHRLLAKLAAAGLTRNDIAGRLDMTPERVGQLMNDPALQDLIKQFEHHPHVEEMAGYNDIALLRSLSSQVSVRSVQAMLDTLDYYEDSGERVPVRESAKMFELTADRIGFGRHQTNINVNVDFATQLEQRRMARLRTVSGNVVSLPSPTPPQGVGKGEVHRSPSVDAPPPRMIRRI